MGYSFIFPYKLPRSIRQIILQISTQSFHSQFSALTTNADRVQFCLAQKEVQLWVELNLFMSTFAPNQNALKCPKTAAKYRETGNDHFRVHKFESAIQLYSRAICFAPQTVDNTASELALAYANRSAAYFQLGQYDNALKDVNVAMTLGYSRFKSVIKLQLRKCDCLIRLGRTSDAEEFLHFMQQPTGDENDTKRWIELFGRICLDDKKKYEPNQKVCNVSLIEKLTNKGLFKSNDKMSSFSTKVAVHYDSVKGRHLVAQEDIQFGDILAVTRPYASLLNPKEDALKYCHHCGRAVLQEDLALVASEIRPIPCSGCSSVVYCSEECCTEAATSYHRYECGQHHFSNYLHEVTRMSLQMLYRAGIDQIHSAVRSAEDASHLSEQPDGHYSHVYQLVHYSDGPVKDLNISYDELLVASISACLLLQLAKNSNFPMNSKEEEKLIGGILARHVHQLCFNTFGYSPVNKGKEEKSPILLDLYPMFASTLNHSCKANSRLESPNNEYSSCLLQATRPISAGTEVTIPYFKMDPSNYSRTPAQQFKERFLVACSCDQCEYCAHNTPFGLSAEYLPLSCGECGHLMEYSSEHRSESEVFSCTNCRLAMTNDAAIGRYRVFGEMQIYYKLNEFKKIPAAVLKAEIAQIEGLLHLDSALMVGHLRFKLGEKYLTEGEVSKFWTCIEQFLSAHGHAFGEESVELMEALDLLQSIEAAEPMMMKAFEQEEKWLYQRYLARLEQLKQLKRKYYPDY